MDVVFKVVGVIVVTLGTLAILAVVMAWPLQLIINYLFTPSILLAVFGVTKLTLWRSWLLMFLCSSLFKSTSSSKK